MANQKSSIREITTSEEIRRSSRIIRDSFKTVASDLSLTRENCPTHPSFVTSRRLEEIKEKGLKFFGLFLGEIQVGFVAIEAGPEGIFYLEKLAVLPEFRHSGYGRELVNFVLNYAKKNRGKKVSLGMINDQKILKDWYSEIGFNEKGVNNYEHLPFTVCFMEKELNSLPVSK